MKKKELNIYIVKKLHEEGLRPSEIAIRTGSHPERIKEELLKIGIDYNKYVRKQKCNKNLIEDIKILVNKGYSKTKIASELNTYKALVLKLCKDNNITQYIPSGFKRCGRCKTIKKVDSFQKSKRGNDFLRGTCKDCRKSEKVNENYYYLYRQKNKDRKREVDRMYRENNVDKIIKYKKSSRYKDIKRQADKNYYIKNISNPSFKMLVRMRSIISSKVKNKKGKTFDILGYTVEDLCNHLESKFKYGMTWDNYGRNGWHIDHIRPLASFDFNNEEWIKEAFSLNNLQPLWESENCSKGSLYNGIRYSVNKSTKK